MQKTRTKLMSLLLVVIMLICLFSGNITATGATATSGTCGENVYWSFGNNGTLVISGDGKMSDGNVDCNTFGWNPFIQDIKTVIITNGVTSIGNGAFFECRNISQVSIPVSVTEIRISAFLFTNITDIYYGGTKEQWDSIMFLNVFSPTSPMYANAMHYNSNIESEIFPNGYDFERDSYSFTNFSDKITKGYFESIFEEGHSKSLAKFASEHKKHGGVCFGMVYTTAAIFNGNPTIDSILKSNSKDGTQEYCFCLRDANLNSEFYINGTNGNLKLTIRDYIRYAYIYQYSTQYGDNLVGCYAKAEPEQIQSVYEYIKESILQNTFVSIRLKTDNCGVHQVLAVGIDGNEVLIDDPNSTSLQKITFSDDFSTWTFSNPWKLSWTFSRIPVNNQNCSLILDNLYNTPYSILKTGNKVVYEENAEGESEAYFCGISKLDTDKLLLYVNADNYQFNADKFYDINISDSDNTNVDEDENSDSSRIYWIENDKSIQISDISGDDDLFSLAGKNSIIEVSVNEDDQVSLTVDEENSNIKAEIESNKGKSYEMTFSYVTEDLDQEIKINGIASGDSIQAKRTEDGIQVTGLNEITVDYIENDEPVAKTQAEVEDGREVNIIVDEINETVITDFVADTQEVPETPTEPTKPAAEGDTLCKYCHQDHGSSFWGKIVAFFHSIFYFFAHLFGKM